MQARYIVKDIVRGQKRLLDAGRLVWYLWDRKMERLGLGYFLTKEAALQACEAKNSRI